MRTPVTSKQALATLLSFLKSMGFHVGSWAAGAIQRTYFGAVARLASDLTELSRTFVEFSLNDYSSGDPLGELSRNQYDNEPHAAVKTVGVMVLTNNATVAHPILPGQLIVGTETGIDYHNLTAPPSNSLGVGATAAIVFEALLAGEAGNVENGRAMILKTSLAGVTVVTGGDTDADAEPWYTTAGADPEATTALRLRNQTKWGTLGIEMIEDGYRNLALSVPGITKVEVQSNNPRGPCTINVLVAMAGAPAGIDQRNALQLLLSKRVPGTVPTVTDDAFDQSYAQALAPETFELGVNGVVYFDPGYSRDAIRNAVTSALNALVRAAPIGGYKYPPGPSNIIGLDHIYDTIRSVRGVRKVVLTTPTADVAIPSAALVTARAGWNLTYTPSATPLVTN